MAAGCQEKRASSGMWVPAPVAGRVGVLGAQCADIPVAGVGVGFARLSVASGSSVRPRQLNPTGSWLPTL